jgi:anti-sigma B factor antagonist
MGLLIKPRVTGDTVVIDLFGRLWILDSPLRDTVQSLLAQGCKFFVLNLEGVDYMDSSGLGQLVTIWTSARTKEGNLGLLKPNEKVLRLLKMTRLHVVIDIFQDEERAKAAIRRDNVA